jgi:predicted ATPase
MFKSVTIKNYKTIKELNDFPLRNINVLIGANGSGKSNFLQFFNFVNIYLSQQHGHRFIINPADHFNAYILKKGGASRFLSYHGKFGENIFCELAFVEPMIREINADWVYLIDEDYKNTKSQEQIQNIKEKVCGYIDGNYHNIFKLIYSKNIWKKFDVKFEYGGLGNEQLEELVILHGFDYLIVNLMTVINKKYCHNVRQYHFHNTTENSPIISDQPICYNERLWPDGGNIAPFIYRLNKEFPEEYEFLIRSIRMLVPDFYDFYIEEGKRETDTVALYWLNVNDLGSESDLRYHPTELSDGSLRIICLLTVLLQPAELMPKVIIIDEPELGLHPQAMSMIADLIRCLSDDKQFIIATQSPEFLDLFETDDVIVVDKSDDGTSDFKRLEQDKLKGWLENYQLSALWKKNVIGGNL